jgi:ribosome-associated toxin RatA of RatAB toxin-antitoxin module
MKFFTMKRTITAMLCLGAFTASAQKMDASKVPSAVTQQFSNSFGGATGVKWEKEKSGDYEAEFTMGGQEMSATFDASGTLKETEREIEMSALPAGVSKYLSEHKLTGKVKEAAELKMADGSVRYEAEVRKQDLVFDAAGNLLSGKVD